jgi:subtilase family serine protease
MYRLFFLSGLFAAVTAVFPAYSQTPIPPRRPLIAKPVNNAQLVTLSGNTRSAANSANDVGRVSDGLSMDHMQLLLQRPAELQQALDQFVSDVQNPASPSYHKWLSATQFGQQFGVADSDIAAITNWLESQGFIVNQVYPNKLLIDFSGTAGQVNQAFHTQIHNLNVNGTAHIANMSDPQVPAALAPAIKGVVSLNDFMPRPMLKTRPNYTFTSGGSTYEAVVPADLATIYNLNPLFSSGKSGQGQTIVVIEDTNVYSTTDWSTFRSKFGLTASYPSGSFTQVHPGNCSNPGVVAGNDGEAILDAEWASAAAPNAAIELASCRDTATTFGGLIALENLLSAGSPPAIVSISYGECEAENGATANAAYNATYEQAVTAGVSVFVSAGDEGAASCDADENYATHGIGVSGFASTPYNVAVGGTDFADTYAGTTANYWNSTNSSTYGSAKSYIPEIPWNDSCASALLATAVGGTTPENFCNSATGMDDFLTTASGSGGPSGCATGSPSTAGVISGTCKGYGKPSWQSVYGNPGDGVRDIPDVSLFAANGVWGHYYVFCWTDTRNGGASCSGAPSTWAGAGGTSFAAPILAGIQAIVNQKTGSRWGNPNPTYYSLASAQYGGNGASSCGSNCVFNDVTLGDMDVVCTGTDNCFGSTTTTSGGGRRGGRTTTTYGVLSTSSTSLLPAYKTGAGWDFATGLGSVNATNLVNKWP